MTALRSTIEQLIKGGEDTIRRAEAAKSSGQIADYIPVYDIRDGQRFVDHVELIRSPMIDRQK